MLTTTAVNPLAALLLEEMAGKKWSAADLARAVGVNRSTVYMWTSNGVIPSLRQRAAIAAALGIDLETVQAKVVQVERLKMETLRRSAGPAPAEAEGLRLHPGLAEALAGLDWEAQAALVQVIQALRETRRQEFRDGGALARVERAEERAGADDAGERGRRAVTRREVIERLRNEVDELERSGAPDLVLRMVEGAVHAACDEETWAAGLREQEFGV